jgi:dTDP-4-dehydrorhamnose 3,5-epimerase
MSLFIIKQLPLHGLMLIERKRIQDSRGYFSRLFCSADLKCAGWEKKIAQINHSFTEKKGTIRGMHYQKRPFTDSKLVSCTKGKIWDVAIDLRLNSPTYLKWYGQILSSENNKSMLIPDGFAHGFQTLAKNCEIIYLHSSYYNADAEMGIRYDDPKISISWPLEACEISERDQSHPLITKNYRGIEPK